MTMRTQESGLTFIFIIALLAIPALVNGSAETSAIDLKTAFLEAKKRTESLAIQELKSVQAGDQYDQALSGILPHVSLIGKYSRQQEAAATGSTSAFLRPDQTTASVGLTQALFRGFSEHAELRRRDAVARAEKLKEFQTELALYRDVSAAYFGVLSAETDLKNLEEVQKLTSKRVDELWGRMKIGRSRRGEWLSAKAQLTVLDSQIVGAKNELLRARQTFHLATGLDPAAALQEVRQAPEAVSPLDVCLRDMAARPDVKIRQEELSAAEEYVTVARGGHFPSLDLSANYYLKRAGVLENVKWDLGVTLTVPIFLGGSVQALVREAVDLKKQAELELARTRREVTQDVEVLHAKLTSLLGQLEVLKRALAVTEENYKTQTQDYRFGLVNNLDVLQALNSFLDTQRVYDKAVFDALATSASLNAAIGKIRL